MGRPVRLLTPFTAVSRDQAYTALLVFDQRDVTASAYGLGGVWRAFKSQHLLHIKEVLLAASLESKFLPFRVHCMPRRQHPRCNKHASREGFSQHYATQLWRDENQGSYVLSHVLQSCARVIMGCLTRELISVAVCSSSNFSQASQHWRTKSLPHKDRCQGEAKAVAVAPAAAAAATAACECSCEYSCEYSS